MKEQFIDSDRGKLYYCISDTTDTTKDTLFFFHGLTADHTMFSQQVDFFNSKYNIICWDAPMHGNSRPYNNFSFESCSMDILNILKQNNIQSIICIGQSLGGYFAQDFIARYPEKVKAFIGIGTSPFGKKYYSASDIFWLKQTGWLSLCYPIKALKKAVAQYTTITKYAYDNMLSMISVFTKKEYADVMQIFYSAFLKENRDITINCPVLITYGDHDKVGKVKHYCAEWAKDTGYQCFIVKNAGHNANVDNPDETNSIISDFLCENVKPEIYTL